MGTTYIRAGDVRKNYNISVSTLANWANQGKVRFIRPGRNRYYHRDDIIVLCRKRSYRQDQGVTVCYARVSSEQQQEELTRQCNSLKAQFPEAEIISDIGSGLDWDREGFRKLLERIYDGNVAKVVIEYKDTLCRFGFELFQWICEKHGVEPIVLNDNEIAEEYSSKELSEDLLAIINQSTSKGKGCKAATHKANQPHSKSPQDKKSLSDTLEIDSTMLDQDTEARLREAYEASTNGN